MNFGFKFGLFTFILGVLWFIGIIVRCGSSQSYCEVHGIYPIVAMIVGAITMGVSEVQEQSKKNGDKKETVREA